MRVAVIPARGGSKRIKRKNIKEFFGKPIIAWSIISAIKCGCFDEIIVSTEDDEIAEIARYYGASVPFIRPSHLADDITSTGRVIQHAISWFNNQSKEPDIVCCIYATAPFISAYDIQIGCKIIENEDCDFVFSAASFEAPVQRGFRLNPNGELYMIDPDSYEKRSQDIQPTYYDAAQFYWGRTDAWLRNSVIFGPRSRLVIIPKYRVRDIDDIDDWQLAELMFGALRQSELPSQDIG